MSPTTFAPLFNLLTLPNGRRLYALRRIAEALGALPAAELARYVEVAKRKSTATWEMDLKWRNQQRSPGADQDLRPLDTSLDRAISAFYHAVEVWLPVQPENAQRLLQLFPNGVVDVVHLTYPEEVETVSSMLVVLGGDLAADVRALHLEPFVSRIKETHGVFRSALDARKRPEITYDEVRAARANAHEEMLRVVAVILGTYPGDHPEHAAARQQLLGPILAQNDAVRASLRGRRPVTEIDPNTGVELDEVVTNPDEPVVE
jgi:hypothetical protein